MTYSTGLPILDASKGWVDPRFIALKDILTLTKILNGDDFMNRKKLFKFRVWNRTLSAISAGPIFILLTSTAALLLLLNTSKSSSHSVH